MRMATLRELPQAARDADGNAFDEDTELRRRLAAPAVFPQHTFEAPKLGALSGEVGYEHGAEAETLPPKYCVTMAFCYRVRRCMYRTRTI